MKVNARLAQPINSSGLCRELSRRHSAVPSAQVPSRCTPHLRPSQVCRRTRNARNEPVQQTVPKASKKGRREVVFREQ